jgi:hypothetical protein
VGRTFPKADYDANYGNQPEQKRVLLAGAKSLLFSSRSLLFIGASLGADRTVGLLPEVHQNYAGVRHFAIMAVPEDQRAFEAKEKHLRTCGGRRPVRRLNIPQATRAILRPCWRPHRRTLSTRKSDNERQEETRLKVIHLLTFNP